MDWGCLSSPTDARPTWFSCHLTGRSWRVDKITALFCRRRRGRRSLRTNLAKTVQTILRYEVDDLVTLADRPCGCGSRLPWIEQVDGRSDEVMWIGEAKDHMLSYILFKTAVEYLHQVREWQAVQLGPNRIEIRLELLAGAVLNQETAEPVIVQKLEELGLPAQVKTAVRIVPSLSADPVTGKPYFVHYLVVLNFGETGRLETVACAAGEVEGRTGK